MDNKLIITIVAREKEGLFPDALARGAPYHLFVDGFLSGAAEGREIEIDTECNSLADLADALEAVILNEKRDSDTCTLQICPLCEEDPHVICPRNVDAICAECGEGYCGAHIGEHLQDAHCIALDLEHCSSFPFMTPWKPCRRIGSYLQVVEGPDSVMIRAVNILEDGSMERCEGVPNAYEVEMENELYEALFSPPADYAETDPGWRQKLIDYIKNTGVLE